MATVRGRLAGNSGSSTGTTITFSLTAGYTGSAPAIGDIVFCVGVVTGSTGGTWSQTSGTGTWTVHASNGNSGGSFNSFCAFRVFDGTETAPTFTYSSTLGTTAWAVEAVTPAGGTIGVDIFATDAIDTTAGNTFAINAATATGTDACSLILGAGRTTVNLSSAITPTPPSGWVGTTNGADYSGFAGGATTRANIAVIHNNLGSLSGSVAPANETTTSAQVMCMNMYHVLLVETGGANVTGVGAAVPVAAGVGSGSGGANAAGVGSAVAVASGLGTPSGGSSVTGVGPAVTVAAGVGTATGLVNIRNIASGGTNGTTVTTGNSGGVSGTAFNVVTIGALATLTFDNTHAIHSALSYNVTTGSPAANSFVQWTTALGATVSQLWWEMYLFLTAYSASILRIVSVRNGATYQGGPGISSTGKVVLLNAAGSTVKTSTNSVPLNQWFRLEGFLIGDPSVGQLEAKLFINNPDAITPDEIVTTTAVQNTTGPVNRMDYGNPSSQASFTFWMSPLGASTQGYLGPLADVTGVAAGVTVIVGAGVGSGGANVVGVGGLIGVAAGIGTPHGGGNVTGIGAQIVVVGGIGIPHGGTSGRPGFVFCDQESTSVTVNEIAASVGTSNQAGSVLVDNLT